MKRRSFLKLSAAAGITLYAEPLILLPDGVPWVEDKGDFYILRVPDGKSVNGLKLDKPTIVLAGAKSIISNVDIDGFCNIFAKPAAVIDGLWVDARHSMAEGRDHAVLMSGDGYLLKDAFVECRLGTDIGIRIEEASALIVDCLTVIKPPVLEEDNID